MTLSFPYLRLILNLPNILNNIRHDLPGYISPSVVTGDEFKLRPDVLITLQTKCLYLLELTIGYESNLLNIVRLVRQKYKVLVK